MKKKIINKNGQSSVIEADPFCGDYCDTCGDCLHCYGEDACIDGKDHVWVEYEVDDE